jgi:hypothetical protein
MKTLPWTVQCSSVNEWRHYHGQYNVAGSMNDDITMGSTMKQGQWMLVIPYNTMTTREKVTISSRTKAVNGLHVNLITITNSSSDHSCIFIYWLNNNDSLGSTTIRLKSSFYTTIFPIRDLCKMNVSLLTNMKTLVIIIFSLFVMF